MAFALSDMQLNSPAFADGQPIPKKYASDGENLSPPLNWTNEPAGTRCFAVICHDPDAPLVSADGRYGFTHWVIYNIPADITSLDEACQDYTQGNNNFDQPGYGGPLPPEGHGKHHYYFWVLALDLEPDLPEGLDQTELLARVEPNILGMNRLVGSYQR